MARHPDLGKLVSSSGTSSSSSPLCVPALFSLICIFPVEMFMRDQSCEDVRVMTASTKGVFVRDLRGGAGGVSVVEVTVVTRGRSWMEIVKSCLADAPGTKRAASLFSLSFSLSHNSILTKAPSHTVAFYFTTGWDWAHTAHGDCFHRSPFFPQLYSSWGEEPARVTAERRR